MRQQRFGFSLVEVTLVIAIVGILSSVAVVSYNKFGTQSGDATSVEAAKASLQAVIAQAAARSEQAPTQLDRALVASSVTSSSDMALSGDANGYSLTLPTTGRGATYSVSSTGTVLITSLSGFDQYTICNDGQKLCRGLTSTIQLGPPSKTEEPTTDPVKLPLIGR